MWGVNKIACSNRLKLNNGAGNKDVLPTVLRRLVEANLSFKQYEI